MKRDDSFENLRTLFAADLLEKVKALQAAVEEANWDLLSTISHQISGSAKSFGYPEISAVAAQLERSALSKSRNSSKELMEELSKLVVL